MSLVFSFLQMSGWAGAQSLHAESGEAARYTGMIDCFRKTYQQEGMSAFFKVTHTIRHPCPSKSCVHARPRSVRAFDMHHLFRMLFIERIVCRALCAEVKQSTCILSRVPMLSQLHFNMMISTPTCCMQLHADELQAGSAAILTVTTCKLTEHTANACISC